MERIIVPSGMHKALGDTFKRSAPFVRKALRGYTGHPDAVRIRLLAKKKLAEMQGGGCINEDFRDFRDSGDVKEEKNILI